MLQKIHIIVALIAALTVTILSLYQNITFYEMCIRLVIIIPAFYLLGVVFRSYLTKLFVPPPEEEEEPLSDEDAELIESMMAEDSDEEGFDEEETEDFDLQ